MISVCIATFNGARFITEQIESILPQLGSEDEIIVSDDGSTDATLAILRNELFKTSVSTAIRPTSRTPYAKPGENIFFCATRTTFGNPTRLKPACSICEIILWLCPTPE